MKTEKKDLVTLVVLGLFLLGFSLWALFKPADAASESERRALAQLPQFTAQSVLSGGFAQQFEDYATDQFPLREPFRRLKALTATRILRQRDNNGLYLREGYLSKLEYPMDLSSLDHVEERLSYLCQRYLREAGCSVYLCAIPDKNYFLAAAGGYPSLDYEAFVQELHRRTDGMQYIDVFDLLELEDYYRTDTHWRQEKLLDVAERLAAGMGTHLTGSYTVHTLEMLHRTNPGAELYLCIGSDMLLTFAEWYRWQDMLRMASLVVESRTGTDLQVLHAAAAQLEAAGGRVLFARAESYPCASSDIRSGQIPRTQWPEVLPPETLAVIRQNRLYGSL